MRLAVLVATAALALPGVALLPGCRSAPPPLADVPPPRDPANLTQPPKPGPDYFWVAGHHQWVPDKKLYKWIPGRWEHIRPGYRLVPAYYRAVEGGKYQYYPERWERIPTDERYNRR